MTLRSAEMTLRSAIDHLASQLSSHTGPLTPTPKPQAQPVEYGKAYVGPTASMTHTGRVSQLRTNIPNFERIAQIASQGKIGNRLETNLVECDRHGVGVWTYIQLPGGKASDPIILKATGMTGDEVRAALKRCGYAFYKPGSCWRTRCDGTPARGRRGNAIGAYKNALQPNGGDDE